VDEDRAHADLDALHNLSLVAGSADTTPPTVPTGITATANGPAEIDLSWTPSTAYAGESTLAFIEHTFNLPSLISGGDGAAYALARASTSANPAVAEPAPLPRQPERPT
jgi:hypothetical protein